MVEAEAEVPKAIAEAFRSGKLGIMDYYKLRNVQADTEMRSAIAGTGQNSQRSARARPMNPLLADIAVLKVIMFVVVVAIYAINHLLSGLKKGPPGQPRHACPAAPGQCAGAAKSRRISMPS